jgi:hypothetical protein
MPVSASKSISGNKQGGIFLQSGSGNGNLIQGNYIGTDITGTFALNTSGGLGIGGQPTSNTMILGNLIGTQRDGISPLGNNFGIRPGVNGNLVGGQARGRTISSPSI